jgi:protein SCO1
VDEVDLEREVERVRDGAPAETLVRLLHEDAQVYRGRSTGATGRMRAWILARFSELGLPEAAIPHVLEELEFGTEPYPVAGAARALRGYRRDADVTRPLANAFANMRSRDEPVFLDSLRPRWPAAESTSALHEILATASWLDHGSPEIWQSALSQPGSVPVPIQEQLERLAGGPASDACCHAPPAATESAAGRPRSLASLGHLVVETHEGTERRLESVLRGHPTVLTFFYTRCDNPNKCEMTIKRLTILQDWLAAHSPRDEVRILGLTYDPAYDLAPRLSRYISDLGLRPGPLTTIGRLPAGLDEVRSSLSLAVGRGGATVNRHAVEVFILDAQGGVAESWSRVAWDPPAIGRRALAYAVARATAQPEPGEPCASNSPARSIAGST